MREKILIIDFGSQYTQLIARMVRELGIYSEILSPRFSLQELKGYAPKGIILSGGPASVYEKGSPSIDPEIFSLGIPILGICYGLQIGVSLLGGRVTPAREREYGHASFKVIRPEGLFKEIEGEIQVWMSHGDRVEVLPDGFEIVGVTVDCPYAAVESKKIKFYGVQFHPEVVHTQMGKKMFSNFLYGICGCVGGWKMSSYLEETISFIREEVGEKHAICAVSGGVDSTVTASLVSRAIGERLTCIFVDNGLLREEEGLQVEEFLKKELGFNLVMVDAQERFLERLRGILDPEEKRRIIGAEFIEVFKEVVKGLREKNIEFLVQGTLYPDLIESRSAFGGPSAKIKTHHNVGGLPAELGFKLIEPLKFLFKDEVRILGRELGLPEKIIKRQPFPGPGLGVRVIGEVTEQRLRILRKADSIVIEEIEKELLHERLWQYFAVLLPVKSVGVMGDGRTYEEVIAIRAVESRDGMTADWARLPQDLLQRISSRIINEVRGVNRVVYDISSKPPSTIEWE